MVRLEAESNRDDGRVGDEGLVVRLATGRDGNKGNFFLMILKGEGVPISLVAVAAACE